jgi:hypothetical protein
MLGSRDNPFEDEGAFDDVALPLPSSAGGSYAAPLAPALAVAVPMVSVQQRSALGGTLGPAPAAASGGSGAGSGMGAGEVTGGLCGCGPLSVEYYRPYFDVDSDDVLSRLRRALVPLQADWFEHVGKRPDLYGPLWICATLVFLIAATSNFGSYLAHDATGEKPWQHDFSVLSMGAAIVFGFAGVSPLVAWGSLHFLGVGGAQEVSLVELICLYGYSILPFLLACLLCAIPSDVVAWLSVVLALAASSVFLIRNLWHRLGVGASGGYLPPMTVGADQALEVAPGDKDKRAAAVLIAGLLGLHLCFAIVLKLIFFGKTAL